MYDRPNGIKVFKQSIPLGVMSIIYESRPNVTSDAASLCLKSGNSVILRGGSESFNTNKVIVETIKDSLSQNNINPNAVNLVPYTERDVMKYILRKDELIDLIIPRGGEGLIRFVSQNSSIPVIKHYKGVCHVYIDLKANLDIAHSVAINSKIQRPGVCNAMETLIINKNLPKEFIESLLKDLKENKVKLRGEKNLSSFIDSDSFVELEEIDFQNEYLDLELNIKLVDSVDSAITHIERYGSLHTESIITEDESIKEKFINSLNSSAIFHNISTRFNDGNELGLGAEIGISTTKLHAFGPMGLNELTSEKFVVTGSGQIKSKIIMLNRISLKNYLTIEHLEVSFEEGLNILTGETGAGKSLVLGAIEVFAQKRFPKELKKIDSEDLEIEINIQDDEKNILLKRVVDKKYQSIFYIDELKVKFEKISEIFDEFFLFFGQKSASKLLLQKNHINYFDQYIMISDSLISLNDLYTVYDSVKKDLEKQKKLLKELEEKEEFYRFKLKELNKLEIESDEEELEILSKLKKNNSEKNNEDISEVVSKIDNLLLKEIYQLSRKIVKIDAISILDEKISNASTSLEEVSYELSKLLNTFENYDEDFDALEDKIYISKELRRKYGLTLDKLIEERTLIQSALDNSSDLEGRIISLEKKLKLAYDQLYAESLNLSKKRKKLSSSFL